MANALEKLRAFGTPVALKKGTRTYDTPREFVSRVLHSNIAKLHGKKFDRLASCYQQFGDTTYVCVRYKTKLVEIEPGKPWTPCPSNSVADIEVGLRLLIEAVDEGLYDEQLEAIKANS